MFRPLMQIFFYCLSSILIGSTSFAAPSTEGIQIYQKNVHLSPEHKQKLADDITRYRNADNLWDVLRESFVLPHYENHPAVQTKIEWFMNNQDYLLRSASRAAPYLYYILQQVKKRHLPAELVLLPIIESGYNPYSLSNVGAAGIWQLMPGTGADYGAKQDWWYDARRDVIASTGAALNYLTYLRSFFDGNWLLATAAYNTGEGNVMAAIRKNIRNGRNTDFWSLPVAQQTRDYVPSLLALAIIISHPEQYPIYFPPVRNAPYLAQVDVGTQINLKYAASLAGISYKKLMQLNPGFNRVSTSTKGPYKLVLPIENVEQFTENLSRSPLNSNPINWIHYKVKSGDTYASITKKFNTTASAIRKLNHLNKGNLRQGTNLLIPVQGTVSPASTFKPEVILTKKENNRENNKEKNLIITSKSKNLEETLSTAFNESSGEYTLQPGDTIYMVRPKDTLEKIAKRFHVNPQLLRTANQLQDKKLIPGKQIIIPTHSGNTELASTEESEKSLEPGDTIYMVRRNDTIEKIAQRFHTTPAAIRLVNLMERNSVEEGERLIIPTHLRS